MIQAKTRDSTPRRTASKNRTKGKKKAKQKHAASDHSKIIEQCVLYVQALAAYDAGFSVDHTGNSRYAGKGPQIKYASRAMSKLIGLSPHLKAGAATLSALELHAKAGVLATMYGLRKGEGPDATEMAYIRFFAGEVIDFLAANDGDQQ
jgi:hypothetical protein